MFFVLTTEYFEWISSNGHAYSTWLEKSKKTFGKIKDACIFALPTTKKASKKAETMKEEPKGD
jgi:hypothetical protein